MLRRSLSLGVLVLVAGFGGSLFGQGTFNGGLPGDAMLGRLGLQRHWWAYAAIDPLQDRVKYFTADERQAYAQTSTGMVTAFDIGTGHRLWAVQVGEPTEVRFEAVTNDQLVVIVSGTTVYALNKKTGEVAWQLKTPTAPSTSPAMDDMRVYVGSVKGAVYAYDLKFLDTVAKNPQLPHDMFHALAWEYRSGARILYPPVTTGNVVTVASADNSLYGLAAKDRGLHYQFETDQALSTPLTQVGRYIFFGTGNQKVYCVNADTGAIKWEVFSGTTVRQPVKVVEDHVFMRPEDAPLRCLSVTTSREIWASKRATGFLAATPSVVYASDNQGNVVLLNQSDGRQIGAFPLRGYPIRIANERTDRLYFASERGLILCVRERERDFPLFHKSPEKGPVLPELTPDQPGNKPATSAKPKPAEKKEEMDEGATEKKDAGDAAPDPDQAPKKPAKKPAKRTAHSKVSKPAAKPASDDQ